MPRCKHCPIVAECNQHPILVNAVDPKGKTVKARLCPLVILLAQLNPKRKEE